MPDLSVESIVVGPGLEVDSAGDEHREAGRGHRRAGDAQRADPRGRNGGWLYSREVRHETKTCWLGWGEEQEGEREELDRHGIRS